MKTKELITLLQNLPEDLYINFYLLHEGAPIAAIKRDMDADESDTPMYLCGYERMYIGDEDNELFFLKFKVNYKVN